MPELEELVDLVLKIMLFLKMVILVFAKKDTLRKMATAKKIVLKTLNWLMENVFVLLIMQESMEIVLLAKKIA